MTTPTPRWTAETLERTAREITHGWMAHLGYTPEQITEYEMNNQHERAGCDFTSEGWFCLDENEKSLHPEYDELDFCAELVMFVLEHPALAGVLTAVGGETRHDWRVLAAYDDVGRVVDKHYEWTDITADHARELIADIRALGRSIDRVMRRTPAGPWREVTDDPA